MFVPKEQGSLIVCKQSQFLGLMLLLGFTAVVGSLAVLAVDNTK